MSKGLMTVEHVAFDFSVSLTQLTIYLVVPINGCVQLEPDMDPSTNLPTPSLEGRAGPSERSSSKLWFPLAFQSPS